MNLIGDGHHVRTVVFGDVTENVLSETTSVQQHVKEPEERQQRLYQGVQGSFCNVKRVRGSPKEFGQRIIRAGSQIVRIQALAQKRERIASEKANKRGVHNVWAGATQSA